MANQKLIDKYKRYGTDALEMLIDRGDKPQDDLDAIQSIIDNRKTKKSSSRGSRAPKASAKKSTGKKPVAKKESKPKKDGPKKPSAKKEPKDIRAKAPEISQRSVHGFFDKIDESSRKIKRIKTNIDGFLPIGSSITFTRSGKQLTGTLDRILINQSGLHDYAVKVGESMKYVKVHLV